MVCLSVYPRRTPSFLGQRVSVPPRLLCAVPSGQRVSVPLRSLLCAALCRSICPSVPVLCSVQLSRVLVGPLSRVLVGLSVLPCVCAALHPSECPSREALCMRAMCSGVGSVVFRPFGTCTIAPGSCRLLAPRPDAVAPALLLHAGISTASPRPELPPQPPPRRRPAGLPGTGTAYSAPGTARYSRTCVALCGCGPCAPAAPAAVLARGAGRCSMLAGPLRAGDGARRRSPNHNVSPKTEV